MGGLRLQENLHAAGRWRFEWFLPDWEVCGTPANAGFWFSLV